MRTHALACLPLLVLNASCRPDASEAACLPLDAVNSSQALGGCGQEICIPTSPLHEIDNSFSPDGRLVCYGCELEAPQSFKITGILHEENPDIDYLKRRYTELTLELAGSWDRTFTPSSLNAALTSGTLLFANIETSSSGIPLGLSAYKLLPGDIAVAYLEGDRLQLEFDAHATAARYPALTGPDCYPNAYCTCTHVDRETVADDPTRAFRADLPYSVYEPPPPPAP